MTADELILRGLTGRRPVRELMFEGRELRYDASTLSLQNMRGAIQHQQYTPLSTLLQIYSLLEEISKGGKEAAELGDSVARLLGEVRPAQLPAGSSKDLRRLAAGIDLEAAQKKWSEFGRSQNDPVGLRRLARKLAADLHPELGVGLLVYCYAYYGSPAIDALAFDVNFVRKHDFLGQGAPSSRDVWHSARLSEDAENGSFVAGSLSGLGCVLSQLETASASLGLEERDSTLLPTMLAELRAIRPALLTDRAQEFAALLTRFGRELLTLAVLDGELRLWCDSVLGRFVPPRRRESIGGALEHLETDTLARLLTPSEFFFLGQAYVQASEAHEQVPALNCPVLDRIREILAEASRSGMNRFREEISQFGFALRGRLGLDAFSVASPESYEDLELSERTGGLFDRICDLKIRLADLQYSLGLPAFVMEVEGELALRDVLPKSEKVQAHSWKLVLDRISRLSIDRTRGWMEEALSRGWLAPASETQTHAVGGPQ
jgi:hypothetical protein